MRRRVHAKSASGVRGLVDAMAALMAQPNCQREEIVSRGASDKCGRESFVVF